MWDMFDTENECDDCGGPGPPPKFMIPPPPRPPFMQDISQRLKCTEDDGWDLDMCEAIPILDASYHSSPSLQTSAMIAVFTLLLVLVVLISSLFVWKHKRKVQNFLPCKTPTRAGHHLNGGVTHGGHSVTYEDPDVHLSGHHRPLVMRHHHNVELLHPKSIHYPSGYPMTRSPPLFVCSSPGPDPYRSNDNVYEELGPGRDSDGESEPVIHSDDEFAEDELSLPGERSFNKTSPDLAAIGGGCPVTTIYHERLNSSSNSGQERNSLISSSSSSSTTATVNGVNNIQQNGILPGVIRQSTNSNSGVASGISRSNSKHNQQNVSSSSNSNKINNRNKNTNNSRDPINSITAISSSDHTTAGSDIVPSSSVYKDDSDYPVATTATTTTTSTMLPFNHHHPNQLSNSFSNNNNNLSNCLSNSNNNSVAIGATNSRNHQQISGVLDSEVERRNRINNQLHHPAASTVRLTPPVATIFRESPRNIYNTSSRYPQPYYSHHNLINNQQSHQRSRTNSRSLDRRRIGGMPIDHEIAYGYAEPVYHEGLLYDAPCLAHPTNVNTGQPSTGILTSQRGVGSSGQHSATAYPFILPSEFTTFRTLGNSSSSSSSAGGSHHYHPHHHQQHQLLQLQPQPQSQHHPLFSIYSRDSSFGSDSGYSHHTQTSSSAVGGGGGVGGVGVVGCEDGLGRRNNTSGSVSSSCNSFGRNSNRTNSGGSRGGKTLGINFSWGRRGSSNTKDNSNNSTSRINNNNNNRNKTVYENS